jgi:hypothetical protein
LSQLIDLEEDEDEALFVASASIRVVDNAIMKAVVKCYFKGSHYLVKPLLNEEPFSLTMTRN